MFITKIKLVLGFLMLGAALPANAQAPLSRGGGALEHEAHMDDVSAETRERIWRDIDTSVDNLRFSPSGASKPMALSLVTFIWPLRAARGYSAPAFHTISSLVDHNQAFPNQLRDYQCGTRTYDQASGNHKGTDIALSPDGWNLMAAGQIEIIAAAAGTIILRQDGNTDTNCKFNNSEWNAVYVQHDDGSVAWYGHMKKNSVTAKAVGQRVASGEYLGLVGSSGNSTGPHLHFEVYDANRNLIDPWAGQCNGTNSESKWSNQRPYVDSQLSRLMTASAPRTSATCGDSGTMSNPGSYFEKTVFAPGEPVHFVATYHDQVNTLTTQYKVFQPDGSIWRQWVGSSDAPFYSSSFWYWTFALEANAAGGTWMFEAAYNGATTRVPFTVSGSKTAPPNYSAIWWNPAEPGWGVNLNHQGDILFATWFTYDIDRSPLWLTMTANLQADGSYTGQIYRTTGINFADIDGKPSATSVNAVGAGSFQFSGSGGVGVSDNGATGTFSYTVNNVTKQKQIERQVFGQLPTCVFTKGTRALATNYQDLWWNPQESGWGINFNHQGDTIFATWFTYRADGKGQWLFSTATRQPTAEYRGRLYRATGATMPLVDGMPALADANDVGEFSVAFADGENAVMKYTLDGVAQSKNVVRQVFGNLVSLCQ